MDTRPIGIFDSGFGGLTVFKEISKELPNEKLVYFGDNGRAPYGTKSRETIIKYTFQNIRFLLEKDIKLIVIACNTVSSCALSEVLANFDIPIIEVIRPGSRAAVQASVTGKIGVIGTVATIRSRMYEFTIKTLKSDAQIYQKACPMFVPLVEEGWWDNDISYLIAKEYLDELKLNDIDTLLLGCTHYPLLKDTLNKVLGNNVKLVSSALEVARAVKEYINIQNIQNDSADESKKNMFYTSDTVEKFVSLGNIILDKQMENAQHVDIEKY